MGDFNNSRDRQPAALVLRAARAFAKAGVALGVLHEAQTGQHAIPPLDRLTSIALRAGAMVKGTDIRAMEQRGFFSANQSQEPTASLPAFDSPQLDALLDKHPKLKAWLQTPHLRLDDFMADQGSFRDFRVYAPQAGDQHCGISVVYSTAPSK